MRTRPLLTSLFTASLGVTLALAACGKKSSDSAGDNGPPVPAAPGGAAPAGGADSPAAEARKTFDTVCSACHGTSGMGDGPAAGALNPKPRNYTDKAWQASVTDDDIKKVILEGGAAVGKSPVMPAQPQFKDKPEVMNELVKIIRAFGK